jgi:hypothetical protein
MPADDELAAFQAMLLDLLASCGDPAMLLAQLANCDESQPFADYVRQMEPRMLEVAALLMQKWGKRTSK